MNKNIEKEFKVLLTKEQFMMLQISYPNLVFKTQINTYYDTEDFAIRKMLGSMRIREKAGTCIFTLKIPTKEGLSEYECFVSENSLDIFHSSEIAELLKSYDIDSPIQKLTTLTTKRAVIETENAEICFDISTYNRITDYELEYEYKVDHDGFTAFQSILYPLHIEYHENCLSKIQRAMNTLCI